MLFSKNNFKDILKIVKLVFKFKKFDRFTYDRFLLKPFIDLLFVKIK